MFKAAVGTLFICSLLTVVTHVTIVEPDRSRPLPTVSAPIHQQLLPELPPVRVDAQVDTQIVRTQDNDTTTTIYQDNDVSQDNDTYITLPAQPPAQQPRRIFRLFLPVVEN